MDSMVRKYHDEEWLRKKYCEERMSSVEIARELDVTGTTIRNWLERHDIQIRSQGPQKGSSLGDTSNLKDEDWLREEYVGESKSTYQIASELDVGQQTVSNWLQNHGIEIRGPKERARTNRSSHKDKRLENAEWLRKEYEEKGRSMHDIAREIGVTHPAVKYRLDQYGIERRNDGPQSKTGDSVFQHDPNWETKRKRRLEIDDYECQDCGVTENEYYRSLDVHHHTKREEFVNDDGSVDWDEANAMDNLISLCQGCHVKRHHKESEG